MNRPIHTDAIKFHHCCVAAEGPYPRCELEVRDNRYDPVVGVALQALAGALGEDHDISPTAGIISLTDFGCQSHIRRVAESLVTMRPRQAFFARASAVMVSTYGSLTLATHGPCVALSGGATAVGLGLSVAQRLLETAQCAQIILMAADREHDSLRGSAVIFSPAHLGKLDELRRASRAQDVMNMSPGALLRVWFVQDRSRSEKIDDEPHG